MNGDIKKALQELGRQGGLKTKKKYGKEHYQKLAKHMNEVKRQKKQVQTQGVKKKDTAKKDIPFSID